MTDVEVLTFGCRLNLYESELVRRRAAEAGLCDAVIVNTCAVTAEAVRQSRQAIRRARRERPAARIIATGCAAQIEPDTYAAMPEVDLVLGNGEKLEATSYAADNAAPRMRVDRLATLRTIASSQIDGLTGHTRAFVEIQNGCDHRCTFCVIPFGRGRSRSVPPELAVEHMRRLIAGGAAEIVLTGVDITAYGDDLPGRRSLGALIERALTELPELKRLRLSSLDCREVDEPLLRVVAEQERLMPHIHLSLQSGDDLILKRMKRRHSRREAVALCDRLRRLRPDVVFGADLIAGFPTETAAMFERSLALVDECANTDLHVFPYSARAGTPAARMPQVETRLVHERAARLRLEGERRLRDFLQSEVGRTRTVLVENNGRGHTQHFAPVAFAHRPPAGAIIDATITAAAARHLHALGPVPESNLAA